MAKVRVIGAVLCSAMLALQSAANPYLSVVERNVFGLREPTPVPVTLPAPVATDAAELILTGIADFRLSQWALLTTTERGKPPRRYTLKAGQAEDNLQVLAIDAEAGTVRVLHGSAEIVLTFDTHGPPTAMKMEDQSRKYVQQAKPFVDAHTQAHALREKREQERRELERAAAEAELATRKISTHFDDSRN